MRVVVASGLIAAVLGLASCGDDDDSEGTSSSETSAASAAATASGSDDTPIPTTVDTGSGEAFDGDACALVSEEEVSTILGVDVIAAPQPDVSGGGVCHWAPAGQSFYTVRLTIGPANHYEILKSADSTELTGLGDEAWSRAYVSAGVPALDIGVRAGENHVLVFFGETDDLAVGEQFTHAVLDGLGE